MKAYYNQQKISSSFQKFFIKFFSLSKPQLKIISFILTGMICAESVVSCDISRKLKDDFALVQLESIERRFRRFFLSFSSIAYSFFEAFISNIISRFCVAYPIKMFISLLTTCFAKRNLLFFYSLFVLVDKVSPFGSVALKVFTTLMLILSLLLTKAFLFALICSYLKITTSFSLPTDGFLMLIFYLTFNLSGCFYCIRAKSFFTFSYYDKKHTLVTKHLRDIKPVAQHSKVLKDVFFTRKLFKTNIVVPTYSNHPDDIWGI